MEIITKYEGYFGTQCDNSLLQNVLGVSSIV